METEVSHGPSDRLDEHVGAKLPRGIDAECAIAAVMTAMTRRMSRGEAQRIVEALPERHRRRLHEAVSQRDEAAPRAGRAEVIGEVAEALRVPPELAEQTTRAVLGAVGRSLPPGRLRRALAQLPRGVASLWGSRAEGPGPGPVPIRPRWVTFEVDPELDVDHPLARELERMHAVPEGFTGASTFSVVTCALARRLSRGEAARILGRMPPALRSLVEPDLANRDEWPEPFHRHALLDRLAERFGIDRPSAELVARAVFGALHSLLGPDDTRHVESQLPEDLADLWRLHQTRLTEVGTPTKVRRAVMPTHGGPRKRRSRLQR
jgi:uncharacterized protein (DUF2267 family)